jgi:hypothetical protein
LTDETIQRNCNIVFVTMLLIQEMVNYGLKYPNSDIGKLIRFPCYNMEEK